MSIGTTIKKLRIARKLTQEELASHLGITSKAVSQWECDRTSPDISQSLFHASVGLKVARHSVSLVISRYPL